MAVVPGEDETSMNDVAATELAGIQLTSGITESPCPAVGSFSLGPTLALPDIDAACEPSSEPQMPRLPGTRQAIFDTESIKEILDGARRHYDATQCCIALERRSGVRLAAAWGFSEEAMQRASSSTLLSRPSEVRRAPIIICDAASDPRFSNDPIVVRPPYARFVLLISLRELPGKFLGTLCLMRPKPVEDFSLNDCGEIRQCAEAIMDEYRKMSSGSGVSALTVTPMDSSESADDQSIADAEDNDGMSVATRPGDLGYFRARTGGNWELEAQR